MSQEIALAYTTDPRLKQLKGRWMDRETLEAAQRRILAEQTLAAINRDENPVRPGGQAGGGRELRYIPVMTHGVQGVIPFTEPGHCVPSAGVCYCGRHRKRHRI
jgi:hypothetical protein